jgi:pyruvate/2-oxoglutarate dehydrogenase complex dihydrolipoamide acyltransferase (E2) component
MPAEVILPDLGTAPGQLITLSVWFADEGDLVYEGDRLVEVLIAGATFDVAAPATGRVAEILAYPDDELQPGAVLGLVETGDDLLDDDATELEHPGGL